MGMIAVAYIYETFIFSKNKWKNFSLIMHGFMYWEYF